MRLRDLFEANIETATLDELARKVVRKTIDKFCGDTWHDFTDRFPDVDLHDGDIRSKLFDDWYNEYFRADERRATFGRGVCWQVSKSLTELMNEYEEEKVSKLPPRLRNMRAETKVKIETKEDNDDEYSKKYNGYYQDANGSASNTIKVFIDLETVSYAGYGAMQEWVFGEGEGINEFINTIIPTFIHEVTHYEQYRRGLSGNINASRGYISKTKNGKKTFYGGHHSSQDGDIGAMRYTSAAHEIEAFAAGAAVQLTQEIHRRSYSNPQIEDDQIDELCRDIANGWVEASQMQRYTWLRQYRDHYIEQGFSGKELEVVFKRFMKTLYRKLQQYKRDRKGKSGEIDPSQYPKEWMRWVKNGLRIAMLSFADELVDMMMANKETYEFLSKAGHFLNSYFFKDYYDYERELKIEKTLKAMAAKEMERFNKSIAA